MWVVMRVYGWHNVAVNDLELRPADGEPQGFLPVFETREQAVAWAGSGEKVVEIRTRTALDRSARQ